MVNMTEEMERLHDLIRTLEAQNADLRRRLNETYDFIHNTGNAETLGNKEGGTQLLTNEYRTDGKLVE